MFDNYIVKQSPAYPQTIHEHRAPTDESVRLLKEMEEKAKNSFIKKIHVTDNTFTGIIYIAKDYYRPNTILACVKFSINGKEYVVNHEYDGSYRLSKEEMMYEFYMDVSKAMAKELILRSPDFKVLAT